MLLNLNQIMSVIFNVPAAVLSTIVASRAVRRLTTFTNQGPEVLYVLIHFSDNRTFLHFSIQRVYCTRTHSHPTQLPWGRLAGGRPRPDGNLHTL